MVSKVAQPSDSLDEALDRRLTGGGLKAPLGIWVGSGWLPRDRLLKVRLPEVSALDDEDDLPTML